MPILRKSSLNQLKRINSEIKKQGGKTERTSDSEKGLPNGLWIHDPIGADSSGKRKIATFEEMFNIDIPDSPTKVEMKNEKMINEKIYFYKDNKWFSSSNSLNDISKHKQRFGDDVKFAVDGYIGLFDNIEEFEKAKDDKNKTLFNSKDIEELKKEREDAMNRVKIKRQKNNEAMKNVKTFKQMFEKTETDSGLSVVDINKNIPKINTWHTSENPIKERDILVAGKYIEFDNFRGNINRIEGKYIFIENHDNPLEIKKFNVVDVLKKLKIKKADNDVLDFSLTGPNNKTLGSSPKEQKGTEPKIDATSKNIEKLSDKIYKVKKISESINSDNAMSKIKKLADNSNLYNVVMKAKKLSDLECVPPFVDVLLEFDENLSDNDILKEIKQIFKEK